MQMFTINIIFSFSKGDTSKNNIQPFQISTLPCQYLEKKNQMFGFKTIDDRLGFNDKYDNNIFINFKLHKFITPEEHLNFKEILFLSQIPFTAPKSRKIHTMYKIFPPRLKERPNNESASIKVRNFLFPKTSLEIFKLIITFYLEFLK